METFKDISPEQIKDWKAKFGSKNIKIITVKTDDGDSVFYAKRPDRKALQAIASYGEKNIEKATNIIIGCVLGGDLFDLEHDGRVYTKVTEAIFKLTQNAETEIKNA
jgi:hypothetical protein